MKVKRLGDYFDQSKEKGRPGLPLLSVTMTNGMVDRDSLDRKMETTLAPGEHLLVRPNDLAYNMMRMWQGALAIADREGLVSPAYIVARPRPDVEGRFAGYYLKSSRMLHRLWAHSYGITDDRLRLYFKDFASVRAEFPPLPEQRRIAEILSAWDAATEQTRKLMASKERMQRGLAQRLLSGRLRFGEFGTGARGRSAPRGWLESRLDGIAEIRFSTVDKIGRDAHESVHLCNYMDVYSNRRITAAIPFTQSTASPNEIERFSLRVGDVLITKDSETPDDIGVPSVVSEPVPGVVCGYHLAIIRPDLARVVPDFLAFEFMTRRVRQQLWSRANGATRYGLTLDGVGGLRISLPPLAEQRRIAAVLNSAEAELVQLRRRAGTLQRQKQGLMQVLLTGKIRVRENPSGA
jgi:type I restriction enzyme S subunit